MKYNFDLTLVIDYAISANTFDEVDKKLEDLLNGSKLAEEYPDMDTIGEVVILHGNVPVTLQYKFSLLLEEELLGRVWSASTAKEVVEEAQEGLEAYVDGLLKGCELESANRVLGATLSDEQAGLDEILPDDDWSDFCVQGDAGRYHIVCAQVVYGKKAVERASDMSSRHGERAVYEDDALYEEYPRDGEGNMLHIIPGAEWAREVRNMWPQRPVDTCECGKSLYDEPAPLTEEEQAKLDAEDAEEQE